ncbi:hypothetical protein M409DRAFT_62387 [Zasmidium cellare ATCC 36951]|uniref:NAD(P)-binding domain-containing protein n=1 Tax=Zasmidium cellare ATCC 36951 TaxID=1080233 RepID=A0A6A6D0B6_ZASCE|nr:uncharacterized protein M409DRAFT_62387 [Zasmidium cellare ATCC 36951]KAF2172625.1 hypothetical protein M409DRAFT_62387 [Zasmidium cellare ATCC 36951]
MSTFLVFGATGGTGRHFINLALEEGHRVKAIVRTPSKLASIRNPNLQVIQGSITDDPLPHLDECVRGSDYVVSMLGDAGMQMRSKINTAFVKKQLVPSMRKNGVKRFLYQAGGLSKPYKEYFSPYLWMLRHTVGNAYAGQHADNEAVMKYLAEDAMDIEWIVHRAGIGSEGSQGTLRRSPNSESKYSVATFRDCAAYNLKTVQDKAAVHTSCHSCYIE